MFKTIAILTALVIGTATMAKADAISIVGSGSYNTTTNVLTFSPSGPGSGSVMGAATGIFSPYSNPNPCFGCVTLQPNPLHYVVGSLGAGYDLFFLPGTSFSPVAPNLLLTLTDITNESTANNSLVINADAIIKIGNTNIPGILTLSAQGGSGINVAFSATASPVPEPASLALFGTGLLGIVGIARRKFNV